MPANHFKLNYITINFEISMGDEKCKLGDMIVSGKEALKRQAVVDLRSYGGYPDSEFSPYLI